MTTVLARFGAMPCLIAMCGCSTVDSRPIHYTQEEVVTPFALPVAVSPSAGQDTVKYPLGVPAPVGDSATTGAKPAPAREPTIASAKVQRTRFDSDALTAGQAGIAYFLPRQLATVTVKRVETTLDEAIAQLAEAELALAVAKAKAAASKAALRESQDLLIAKGDNPVVRDLLVARISEQKDAVDKAGVAAANADIERNKKKEVLKAGAPGSDKLAKVEVEIALMTPIADPRHGYRLNPRHSAFRDDKHKFDVSAKGLLNSTDIVAADRTADILVELATAAGFVASGRNEDEKSSCSYRTEVSAVVDLADQESVNDLNSVIQCLGARLEPVGAVGIGREPMNGAFRAGAQGIFYRTPVDVLIRIRQCVFDDEGFCTKDPNWPIAQIIAVSLPQAGPISYVPQRAGPMTTTHYALAFKDGILTSYDSTRPSELLEVARTPMRMINGFFEGASKIISIRTGQNNARATMVQSETALQTAQLNSQTTLSAAELAASQALLRDQAKRDAMNRCIGERVTRGEPYDSCFTGL